MYLIESEFSSTISIDTAEDILTALDIGLASIEKSFFDAYESYYYILHSNIKIIETIENDQPGKTSLLNMLREKNTHFMNLLILKAIQAKIEFYIQVVLQTVTPLAQEHLESFGMIPAIQDILSIEDYTKSSIQPNYSPELLQDYRYAVEIRGDGNCGYRAIVASMLINAIESRNLYIIYNFKELVRSKFANLFQTYDTLFDESIQEQVGNVLQQNLIDKLTFIEKYPSIQSVQNAFNDSIEFDFFIVMFIRYLIIDYAQHNRDIKADIEGLYGSIDAYAENILTWKTYIDNLELTILSQVLSLKIIALIENAPKKISQNPLLANPQIFIPQKINLGFAVITNTGDHYNVVVPKTFDIASNDAYGVNLHVKKDLR